MRRNETVQGTIKIRRDLDRTVRPNAECLDGLKCEVVVAWLMDEGDPYPGEFSLVLPDHLYEVSDILWIASGDFIEGSKNG